MFIETVVHDGDCLNAKGAYKFAMDLAVVLEWGDQTYASDPDTGFALVDIFRETFERFNACLVESGAEPVIMPSRWALPLFLRGHDEAFDSKSLNNIMATSPIIKEFARCIDADGIFLKLAGPMKNEHRRRMLIRVIDGYLAARGWPQSHAQLAHVELKSAAARLAPKEPLTALCVDDNTGEIVRTLASMAGWKGLALAIHRQTIPPAADTEEMTADRLANEVIATGAEIILMDHGLINTDGAQVIRANKRIDPKGKRVFVANTGGDARRSFAGTGAIGNCQKGHNLNGIEDAICILQGDPLPERT